MAPLASWRARSHRGLYWTAVLLSVAALVTGGFVAVLAYAATGGPAGAVKGYFAALARGDAPAALGFGDLPAGPRNLLSTAVLREQHRIAPIRDVHVSSTDQAGHRASVTVTYALDFADGRQQVTDNVAVIERNGSWRLAAAAVSVQLVLNQAADRARILDTVVPTSPVLLFPGAIPIRFDTPYLQLSPATSAVQLDGSAEMTLMVTVTTAGRAAVQAALNTMLPPCLAGAPAADPRCPVPVPGGVPGSLHGTLVGTVDLSNAIVVADTAPGLIELSAMAKVSGSYQSLDFNDVAVTHRGTISVPLNASGYATPPLQLSWTGEP